MSDAPTTLRTPGHYDRHGMPISLERWRRLHADHRSNVQVMLTIVSPTQVSTIWTGYDSGYDPHPALYGTALLGIEEAEVVRTYANERDAVRGHLAVVKLLRKAGSR